MAWQGWLLLAGVVCGTALVWYLVNRSKGGPAHCMGCGKCDETGICVLNGEPVRRKGRTDSPLDEKMHRDFEG